MPIRRPRVAATDGSPEPALANFTAAADADLVTRVATERMLAGISTRKYRRANEPMGEGVAEGCSGESKSAVSRRFVRGTQRALDELVNRDLGGVEVAVLMVDGVDFADQTSGSAAGMPTLSTPASTATMNGTGFVSSKNTALVG